MKASVAQASTIATAQPTPGNRHSRLADNGAFGEALGSARSRAAHTDSNAKVGMGGQHWRQGTLPVGAEMADDTGLGTVTASANESDAATTSFGDAGAQVEDDLDVAGQDAPDETDAGAKTKEEDTSFPAHIKAEHAISAFMAVVPMKRDTSVVDTSMRRADIEGADIDGADAVLTESSEANTKDNRVAITANAVAEQPRVRVGTMEAEAWSRLSTGATGALASLPLGAGTTAPLSVIAEPSAAVIAAALPSANEPKAVGKSKDDRHGAQPAGTAGTPESKLAAEDVLSVSLKSASGEAGDNGNSDDSASRNTPRERGEPLPVAARMSVLAQQTAPAPAAVLPLGTNTATIVSALEAELSQRPAGASAAQPAQALRSAAPMRSLKIQLHPAELGVVTANLKASGEHLSVELQVDNQEAYHRLSADSDAIVKSLQSMGFDIDRISIQQPQAVAANVARADVSANSGSFSRDVSSFQPGSSGDGSERFSGQTGGRGHGSGAERNDQAQAMRQDRTGGGLYI